MSQLKPNDVAKVARYLFKRYTEDNGVPPDNHPDVTPYDFLSWLHGYQNQVNPGTMAEGLGVDTAAVVYMLGMANEPTGPNKLIAMWPYVILSQRVTKNPLLSMQLFLVLTWEDRTVAPLSIFLHRDVTEGPLNDAAVCSTVTTHSQSLLREVMERGLDHVHDSRQGNGLFGSSRIVQLIQGLVNGTVDRAAVPDSDMVAANQLLHFMAQMFIDHVPQEAAEELRAKARGGQQADGEPRGGFDTGG